MGLALLRMFVFLYSRIPEKKLYETYVATLPSSCENVFTYKRRNAYICLKFVKKSNAR